MHSLLIFVMTTSGFAAYFLAVRFARKRRTKYFNRVNSDYAEAVQSLKSLEKHQS